MTRFAIVLVATLISAVSAQAQSIPTRIAAEVQTHLQFLGFDPGGVDGAFGGGSRRALRIFQVSEGLTVTGEPDPETRKALRKTVNERLRSLNGASMVGRWGTGAS